MGNLIKLVPSLVGNKPSLDSLLPILSELASSRNRTKVTPTTTATPHQTTPDELILSPVLIPKLQVASSSPSTSMVPQPIYKDQRLKHTPENKTTEPISLEMFNKAAMDLESKGVINLKRYTRYLNKKTPRPV